MVPPFPLSTDDSGLFGFMTAFTRKCLSSYGADFWWVSDFGKKANQESSVHLQTIWFTLSVHADKAHATTVKYQLELRLLRTFTTIRLNSLMMAWPASSIE